MNDEDAEKILYDLSTTLDTIGSMYWDNTTHSISAVGANSSFNVDKNEHAIELRGEGTVKVGELIISVPQFETCLRHLLKITKDASPEEFI